MKQERDHLKSQSVSRSSVADSSAAHKLFLLNLRLSVQRDLASKESKLESKAGCASSWRGE